MIGLLRAGRPLLLLFGEAGGRHAGQARDWAQAVSTVHVEPTDRIPYDALLVRPDGYVAWASAPGGDRLEDALELYFGSTSGAVYGSGDAGGSWSAVAEHLPPVYSVRTA